MNALYETIRQTLSGETNWEYTNHLTTIAPRRISGMGDDRVASEWVVEKFKAFGLEAEVVDFEAFNSNPVASQLKILEPVNLLLQSNPCCHILSTPEAGVEMELIYVGAGDYKDYEGIDAKGKAVLVEVSYSPATPEKSRIASEMGAAAMICANWGEDGNAEQDYICGRGLKAVWGNPTPETYRDLPQIAGVGITHSDGLYLKELCQKNDRVKINLSVQSTRSWDMLPMPVGYLRGTEEPEKYLLVNGHIDAWEPGVTCNGTGNGTILTLAEQLAKHRDQLKRSIYFICWNGHEIAESAGSTWYVDHHWDDLEENCVGGINIDSTGMLHGMRYECSVSREVMDFAENTIGEVLGDDWKKGANIFPLEKVGDQSFFGIGITSFVGRIGLSDEYMKKHNGATLGWWNHTIKDGMDKVDKENLKRDLDVAAAVILHYVNDPVLPLDYTRTVDTAIGNIRNIMTKADPSIEMQSILERFESLAGQVQKINALRDALKGESMTDERVRLLNALLLQLGRSLTWVLYTFTDRFEQNSYSYSPAARPIPFLSAAVDLAALDKESLAYKLAYTEAVRCRNRVSAAISEALRYCNLYLRLIG